MAKAKKKTKPCTCAEQVDKLLVEHNTRIVRRLRMNLETRQGGFGPSIEIKSEKIDPKKRMGPKIVTGSYCPFCGQKNR